MLSSNVSMSGFVAKVRYYARLADAVLFRGSQMETVMSFPQTLDKATVNPDLIAERAKCSFSVDVMTELIYGKEYIGRLARIKKLLAHNPKVDLTDLWYLNKYDRYMRACERAEEVVRLARTYKLDIEDLHAIEVMIGEDFFLHLHLTMFLPTLQSMADDEQQKEWVPLARDFRIFGTYAQTELGHGSNVPGLETVAKFDPTTDEWVINTPTLTSTKWWPGGLAKSCTHCILMAQLVIGDKSYGPHPFFLPIRSMENHESLTGVFLADIGQKMGYNGMDNGCMQLQNVRIPRRNLLMRYAHVDPQGNYKKQGNQRMMYGAMTFTRKQIIMTAGPALAKAVVIAIRYSAVRRQFTQLNDKQVKALVAAGDPVPEAPVLDYSTQLYMLLPLLAASYAYSATSEMVSSMYTEMMSRARAGDFDLLGETHIVTSALKASMTVVSLEGIETCRRACGGHGFLHASGIPGHQSNYAPQPTYEGDFVVLSIQAGRALLKEAGRVMAGKPSALSAPSGSTSFLSTFKPGSAPAPSAVPENLRGAAFQLDAFRRRAAMLSFAAAQEFMQARQNLNGDAMKALDHVKIDFTRVTVAYGQLLVLDAFAKKIAKLHADPVRASEVTILTRLLDLYALSQFDKHFVEFLQCGVFTAEHVSQVLPCMKNLLAEIRPDAVSLVDAWNFPDYLLNSALGRFDGRAYEALFDSVKFDANNKADVHESYFKHLQYILHPERKVQGSYAAFHSKL